MMNKIKKTALIFLAGVLMIVFCVSGVLAAEFKVPEKGGSLTIGKDETVRNLYTAGNMISVEGKVEKDLFAAGNIITVSGDVEDDLWAAAGTLVVRGRVGGSVHAAGGNVLIEGEITEDIFLAGGNVTLSESAKVGGDLIIAGGAIDIKSPVEGNLYMGGGEVNINSRIGGDVKAQIGEKLTLGQEAQIAGNLKYSAKEELSEEERGRVTGEIEFSEITKKPGVARRPKEVAGIFTGAFLIKLLMGIAAGLVLVYLFRVLPTRVINESLRRFWSSLGLGFSALILTPVLVIILLITVIGVWLAGILGVVYATMVILSMALASIVFGSWLLKIWRKPDQYPVNWKAVVLGVIILNLIVLIPFVGWLVWLVFMLISLGALYRLSYQSLRIKK